MTKPNRQWIHADADYYRDPLALQLKERFGWSGVVFFDAFLRGCKRSVPQGQVTYNTEEELLHFLGLVDLPLVTGTGDAWTIPQLWRFLACRKPAVVTRHRITSRAPGAHHRRTIAACAWDDWEKSASSAAHAERMRRSRAQKRGTNVAHTEHERGTRAPGSMEVGGGRLEVGGGSVRGGAEAAPVPASASPQGADAGTTAKTNGQLGRPDPSALVAMVAAIENQASEA